MTQQIALRISDELAERLDATAKEFPNRSEALRVAIEEFVARRQASAIDQALVDGYTKFPSGQPDEWGSIEASHAVAAVILARSLEAEDGGW
jgi:Arc/MetJ-type ribon-helix-helix transcriptional regulator